MAVGMRVREGMMIVLPSVSDDTLRVDDPPVRVFDLLIVRCRVVVVAAVAVVSHAW